MNTSIVPACYGVCCYRAEQCARYQALDGVYHVIPPIGTCLFLGVFTLFVPIGQGTPHEPEKPEQPTAG